MKYYSSGKKESESSYKDGKKNGLMIGWFENGQKKFVMKFKDGKEVSGSTTEWLKNEQEVYEVINNMNERTATVIAETNKIVHLPNEPEPFTGKYDGYYSSGKKKFETNYKDGKKNGLDASWHENRQKYAETDSSAKNRNVPMESLGLSLGAPFTLTECPFDSPNSTDYKSRYDLIKENKTPCWEHYSYSSQPGPLSAEAETVWLVVSEVPLGINKESILATVLKGNLEKLVISTFGFDAQEVVLSKLVSKYGKPSEISASKEQNRIGASFENITAIWNFPNLSVAFFGMDINTVHGNIDIQTPQATAYIEQLNRQKTAMEPKL